MVETGGDFNNYNQNLGSGTKLPDSCDRKAKCVQETQNFLHKFVCHCVKVCKCVLLLRRYCKTCFTTVTCVLVWCHMDHNLGYITKFSKQRFYFMMTVNCTVCWSVYYAVYFLIKSQFYYLLISYDLNLQFFVDQSCSILVCWSMMIYFTICW